VRTLCAVNDLRRRARLAKAVRDGRARQIRRDAHVTLATMAAELGVTKGAVSAWELGRRYPGPELADRWQGLLEEIEAELADGSDAG
jgi:transcriptional regulator with XRE-family HTH domain